MTSHLWSSITLGTLGSVVVVGPATTVTFPLYVYLDCFLGPVDVILFT